MCYNGQSIFEALCCNNKTPCREAERAGVLGWDGAAVQLLCWEPVQVSLCLCPCPASRTHELPF